jgi:hypothetical protein
VHQAKHDKICGSLRRKSCFGSTKVSRHVGDHSYPKARISRSPSLRRVPCKILMSCERTQTSTGPETGSRVRNCFKHLYYRVCQGFWQAEFAYRGSVLGLSRVMLLFQLPLKMTLDLNVIKIGSKMINSLP